MEKCSNENFVQYVFPLFLALARNLSRKIENIL